MTRDGLERVFLTEPVHRPLERHTWGTVYTTSYDVVGRSVRLLWPSDEPWEVHLDTAAPGEVTRRTMVTLPPLLERPAAGAAHARGHLRLTRSVLKPRSGGALW